MFNIVKKSILWGGRNLTIETGRLAKQADGSVLVTYGNTNVLCCVVFDKKPSTEEDFFPLNVHYQEKFYAAGRIPGGFSKREGKPADHEALISRLIDRPLRPIFDKNFKSETQIICTVLSNDTNCNTGIVSMIGASAALAISGIPTIGVVGACAVGYRNGKFELNTSKSTLDLVVAGNEEGVLMVEASASELSEQQMIDAIWFGHEQYQPIIQMIKEFAKEVSKPIFQINTEDYNAKIKSLTKKYKSSFIKAITNAYEIKEKLARRTALSEAFDKITNDLTDDERKDLKVIYKSLESEVMRANIIKNDIRIDGRIPDEIRPITIETGLLPVVHGSALFTRGETQSIATLTLGSYQDEQIVETINGDSREHFMMHYNFDPYCVGEVARLGAISRREIGHGRLAYKALLPVLPEKDKFPYTIRVVSEITESNGSSSMASVCGGCLAMMQGGVPIKAPVSGVAMGLIKDKKKFIILTDISGDEDALGDMDFKVAGTTAGITALQMDIKATDISREIMHEALEKAKVARGKILDKMLDVQHGINTISLNAPQIKVIKIAEHATKDLIGPGGKNIREITDKTGSKIDVCDGGIVKIFSANNDIMDQTISMIKMAISGPELDDIFSGKVVKIISSGAFVKISDNKEGFLHISELSNERVENITDILHEGDVIKVKVINVSKDKIRLTIKGI